MVDESKEQVKIFIASSKRAERGALELAGALRVAGGKFDLVPETWLQTTQYSSILQNILTQTAACDFAAILLTRDDVLYSTTAKGEKKEDIRKARDNCIFEAGLFAGALGPDAQRCFLLVSVDPRALPSDLAGIRYIDIYEFGGDKSEGQVKQKFKDAALEISRAIETIADTKQLRPIRGLKLPLLSQDELMRLEVLEPKGNLHLHSANVFVSSAQPLELDPDFARRTVTNMVAGKSDYLYVLEAHTNGARMIANLIGSLAEVEFLDDDSKTKRKHEDNIQIIRERLRIYFLPDLPGQHYCIHNADLYDFAICYLRSPVKSWEGKVQFVEWCRGTKAVTMGREITRICVKPPVDNKRVFNSTIFFGLYDTKNEEFKTTLLRELLDRVSKCKPKELEDIFFGNQVPAGSK